MTGTRVEGERGSGSVLVVALVAVVLVLATAIGLLVRVQTARSGAQSAADLAALAAAGSISVPRGVLLADAASGGTGGACSLAGDVVGRNGGSLARCTVQPHGVVQVTVTRPAAVGEARATARAGPAWLRAP